MGFQKGYTPWNKYLLSNKQPAYKNGRMKTDSGYIRVLMLNHPFKDKHGYVREHRLVMEKHLGRYLRKDEQIDHINGIRDDNRIKNLRLCTGSQNLSNRGKNINNTTGFKGVYVDKRYNKFYAQIGYKNRTYNLGTFISAKEAALAYNKKAIELFGEFIKPNIIE